MGGCRRWQLNLIDFPSNTACRCSEGAYSHTLWLQLLASSLLQGAPKSTGLSLRSKGKDKGTISVSNSRRGSPLQVRNAQSRILKQNSTPFKHHNFPPQSFLLPRCSAAAACAFLPAVVILLASTDSITVATHAKYAWWTKYTNEPAAVRNHDL